MTSVLLAALSLVYLFASDLLEVVRSLTNWTGSYSVALPLIVVTIGIFLLPGVVWVVIGEVEDVVRKWVEFPPGAPTNYVREQAPIFGAKFEDIAKTPTFVTAGVLFLVLLLEAELISRGPDGIIERAFLLDRGWAAKPWTLVTSGLAHDGLAHYGGNLVVLLMAGPFIDTRIGWKWWASLFVVANALGGLTQVYASPPGTTVLGSSPAILTFFVLAVIEVPPTWSVGNRPWERRVWLVVGTFSVLALLVWLAVLTQTGAPGIGHWAHLAGAGVGMGAAGLRVHMRKGRDGQT